MSRSFGQRHIGLTGAWRDMHAPPRFSDVALQLVVYNEAESTRNLQNSWIGGGAPRKTPRERQDLVEALSNPMVYPRNSDSLTQLKAAIWPLVKARAFLLHPKYKGKWHKYLEVALRQADDAWANFAIAFAKAARDDIMQAGGTSGMWKKDERCRQAVGRQLLELRQARLRNINAIQQMCLMNERGWPPNTRSLSSKAYEVSITELLEFVILLTSIDRSLKRAIGSVVKRMVAKGKEMHEANMREQESGKSGEGVEDGVLKLVI
ncbi:hypothetical protein QFC22_004764 [Naganishia vaughanmartiniae]|uniref:Uncharacterized protein n=1 Tax=Naganishia vaughanmartiniae TaxID=1424756 RepID=A0ACC2WYY9_9TREE|nr:hypothetical protein QFC22_004764 [Naganishia vaughanmartiniae]